MALMRRSRRSLGNLLIRRVQRHAALATLFRSSSEQNALFNSGTGDSFSPFSPAAAPVVSASLVPVYDYGQVLPGESAAGIAGAAASPALPSEAIQPARQPALPQTIRQATVVQPAIKEQALPVIPPPAANQPPAVLQPPAVFQPPVQAASAPTPLPGRPAASGPVPIQRAAAASPIALTAQPSSGSPAIEPSPVEEATVWRRLQNIFRKHEQQRQTEEVHPGEAATDALALPSSQPGQTVQRQTQAASPSKPELLAKPRSIVEEQPLPGQPLPPVRHRVVNPPASAVAIPSIQEIDPSALQAQDSSPRLIQASTQAPAQAATQAPVQAPTQAPASQPPTGSLAGAAPPITAGAAQDLDRPPKTENPPAAPIFQRRSAFPNLPAPAPEAPEPFVSVPAHLASSAEAPALPAAALPPPVTAPQPAEPAADLQPMPLEAAWPVQRLVDESPTPSVRTPAEGLLPPPSSGMAVTSEAHHVNHLLKEVQPGQPTDSSVETITPRRPRPASPLASTAGVLPKPAELSAAQPGLVPTEIGDLPIDLWQLIGQEPPAASAGPIPGQLTPPAPGRTVSPVAPQPTLPPALQNLAPAPAVQRTLQQSVPQVSTPTQPGLTQLPDQRIAEIRPMAQYETVVAPSPMRPDEIGPARRPTRQEHPPVVQASQQAAALPPASAQAQEQPERAQFIPDQPAQLQPERAQFIPDQPAQLQPERAQFAPDQPALIQPELLQPEAVDGLTAMRSPLSLQQPGQAILPSFSSLVQMEIGGQASDSAPQEPGSSEQTAQVAPAAEINVDELTRRVYQEIKRRLSTEWERMRRKL